MPPQRTAQGCYPHGVAKPNPARTRPTPPLELPPLAAVPVNGAPLNADMVVTASERRSFLVDLVGRRYTLTPPKAALAMKAAIRAKTAGDDPTLLMESIMEWVRSALGDDGAADVTARLDDPADRLDIEHLTALMGKVQEATTGNPPT